MDDQETVPPGGVQSIPSGIQSIASDDTPLTQINDELADVGQTGIDLNTVPPEDIQDQTILSIQQAIQEQLDETEPSEEEPDENNPSEATLDETQPSIKDITSIPMTPIEGIILGLQTAKENEESNFEVFVRGDNQCCVRTKRQFAKGEYV